MIRGAGRGKALEVPTLNFDVMDAPRDLDEGIFACRVVIDGKTYKGAMHYGPRPVFKDAASLEVHIINAHIVTAPKHAEIEVIERLREVENFSSPELLQRQMLRDIDRCRAILNA